MWHRRVGGRSPCQFLLSTISDALVWQMKNTNREGGGRASTTQDASSSRAAQEIEKFTTHDCLSPFWCTAVPAPKGATCKAPFPLADGRRIGVRTPVPRRRFSKFFGCIHVSLCAESPGAAEYPGTSPTFSSASHEKFLAAAFTLAVICCVDAEASSERTGIGSWFPVRGSDGNMDLLASPWYSLEIQHQE